MSEETRPRFSICHVPLTATDPIVLGEFYAMQWDAPVAKMAYISILELRGGTHLVIFRGEPGASTLDLMVDDLDDIHGVSFENVGGPYRTPFKPRSTWSGA